MRLAHLVAFATVTLAASLTGCASHRHPTHAAATDESAALGTSCEEGDPACTCVDIDGGDYDHVCKVDSDCVAITVGTLCGAASCLPANTAVNKDSYGAFQQDRQQVEYASCTPVANGTVSCVNNACVLQGASGSGGAGYADGGGSAGDGTGTGDDGTGTGIEIDLGDDDDTTVTVPDPPSAGDDDDGNGNGGSSSGDDDDDDDSNEGKRHPHPQSRHGHAATPAHSPAVTDIIE